MDSTGGVTSESGKGCCDQDSTVTPGGSLAPYQDYGLKKKPANELVPREDLSPPRAKPDRLAG
jgi:hypothetical protein